MSHPATSATRNRNGNNRSSRILAALIICLSPVRAADPPPDNLIRQIAHHEDQTLEERQNYAYRQTVRLDELDARGAAVGHYAETRDIIFSPQHDRSEKLVSLPFQDLKRLKLTDEDFQDLRDIQPFVLREEFIHNYDVKFRGDEAMDSIDCWVVEIRPKQILQNQRFFEGLLWASKKDFAIIRTEGRAVPQIYSLHQENLFPRFTTIRKPVNGFWLPYATFADDTLPFSTGPVRIKLTIRYTNYQRFGSSTIVTFEDK